MAIPEYIIVMTWVLGAVIIVSIITAILFKLYIMFLDNEKRRLSDRISDYEIQIVRSKEKLENLEKEIKVLESKKKQ